MTSDEYVIRQPIEAWKLVAALLSVLASSMLYGLMLLMAPGFAELFSSFGAELPALTSIVLENHRWFGVLILIGLVPCVLLLLDRSRADTGRLMTLIVIGFGLSLFLFGLFVFAIYAPIFKMGSAI